MKDDMKIEMEANSEQQLKRIVEHMDNMARLSNDTVQELTLQNTRLQAELDKVVHKLNDYEKALKEYAELEVEMSDSYDCFSGEHTYDLIDKGTGEHPAILAQETLKKWEDK